MLGTSDSFCKNNFHSTKNLTYPILVPTLWDTVKAAIIQYAKTSFWDLNQGLGGLERLQRTALIAK